MRQFYRQLMAELPDLSMEIVRRHVAAETIILGVIIRARSWERGAGFPVPAGYTLSNENDRLAGERIYYDRAMVLGQAVSIS